MAGIWLTFIVAIFVHSILERMLVFDATPLKQPQRQFYTELSIYFICATSLAGNAWISGQDLQLSIALFMWPLIIGYFASIECALERERECFRVAQYGATLDATSSSFAVRLNKFISSTVLIVILGCAQVGYNYMNLDTTINYKMDFIVDIMFILGLTVSLSVRIIYSYSKNLQHLFDSQVNALRNIQQGNLERFVPVQSQDEFGVMAQQTNRLIKELHEKQKIQKTLEQIVSPDIMKKLLNGNAEELKTGQDYEIAILFCDLRQFTTYTENTPSEQVIFFLNSYFTKIADIVAEHNGIINKFMGDAILAIYGIDGNENFIEDAVATAWDILDHSGHVCMRDGARFDVGIGVHTGRATACTLGSSERYEYTFIGDSVNTASRLDSLSKDLGYKLLISDDVHNALDNKEKARFTDLGLQTIRGKYTPLRVYGAGQMQTYNEESVLKISGG